MGHGGHEERLGGPRPRRLGGQPGGELRRWHPLNPCCRENIAPGDAVVTCIIDIYIYIRIYIQVDNIYICKYKEDDIYLYRYIYIHTYIIYIHI